MNLDLEQIAQWTGCTPWNAANEPAHGPATGYSIDSRTLAPGDLFFAIRGERFDGHEFVTTALERGARAAVVSRARFSALPEQARRGPLLISDGDPLAALQTLAAAVRRHWGRRVVGVTGSAGKTTTKEAVAQVLASRFRVLKSQGNLNNGFGLPLQLLRLEKEHEVAVIEMGMSHPGEIAALARIAAPDWGVVTNVGNAHAENFTDGITGIARAKYELVEALPSSGVAFLNCGDPYVAQFGRNFRGKAVYFGSGPCAEPHAEEIEELGPDGLRFCAFYGLESVEVRLALLGRHNVVNAMGAIAVGVEAGIPLAECGKALSALRPADKRGEVLSLRGATIINDCYNSNPEALQSMIDALAALAASRRILVAGEMLELGREAAELHRACGLAAARAGIDRIVGVRGNAAALVEGAREGGRDALFVESPEEAGAWLAGELKPGDAVLLKASRGVRLERALEALKAASEANQPE